MEERIIDDEDARLVKIKRTKNGDDVVEDTGEEAVQTDASESDGNDYTVEFEGDEDYDEDLVGLTPAQLKEELERRERMQQEAQEAYEECVRAGRECFDAGDYDGAAENFSLAVSFVADGEEAQRLLWAARAKQYPDLQAYYIEENARELANAPRSVREDVLSRDGAKLTAARENLLAEIKPLEQEVLSKRKERRDPLLANKNYYRVRLCVLLLCLVCFAVASGISAYYTVRTTSITPIVTCAVFGGGALISLIFTVFYTRFLLVALRLYLANENLSSTEDGKKLLSLKQREACLALILEGEQEEEDGEAERP